MKPQIDITDVKYKPLGEILGERDEGVKDDECSDGADGD